MNDQQELAFNTQAKSRENPWLSLVFNIAIPTLILMKLSGEEYLGPKFGLVVALAFPLAYGAWDFYERRNINFISALGFVSILVKGGLGLFELNILWFAVNEAALPSLLGLGILVSILINKSLVEKFLLNDQVVHKRRILNAVRSAQKEVEFKKAMNRAGYLLVLSFLVSAVLNFALAIYYLKSLPGTEQFNEELGTMTAISFPVIMSCSLSILIVAIWQLFKKIKELTGLTLEEILIDHSPTKSK